MEELNKKGELAKKASLFLARMSSDDKKAALEKVSNLLVERYENILSANKKDL